MEQLMQNPEDISDPTTTLDMALELMSKAFQLNNITPTNNNKRSLSNPCYNQIAQSGMNIDQDRHMLMVDDNVGNQLRENAVQNIGNLVRHNAIQNQGTQNVGNQNGLSVVPGITNQHGNGNVVAAPAEGNGNGINGNPIRCYNCQGEGHYASNCTVKPRKRDVAYLQTQLLIAQKEEAEIQLNFKEFDFMAAAGAYDEIEKVTANCNLQDNLQQASTSGTQSDKALVYDSDGSAEVHHFEKCYDNDIFNMFTQEEQYTELLEPIPEPYQVQQNDSNVISAVFSVEQSGGIVEQHSATVEETRAYHESLFHNLAAEVEKVNSVNSKMKETNADLTTELARYKNQEKYDKLKRCYQKSFYQKQCLTKKINALHLSSGKQITTLNEEISNLNKQLSKEKSTVSSLLEEKKKLKFDFKIREDELLDKQIQLENKIKELYNILVKTEATKFVRDFKSLAKKAYESIAKQKALELEIEHLLREVISQDIMSIVQNPSVVDTSNLQTKLERMKEQFENCIIKKENEYAKLWNDWYKKCEECKYDKISYDKAYNDMQQKIERLQAQLGDQKGKSKGTPCVSDTLDPLSQKLENENVELKFQVLNYAKENAHLKTTYKNLFDSISVTRAQTKTIIDSLQHKLHDTIYENAKLRAQLFDKVSDQVDTTKGTSTNTKFANQKVDETNDLSNPVTSNSVPTPHESKGVKHDNVIAPGMFRINPLKPSREEKYVPIKVRASDRTTPITVSQPHVVTKKGYPNLFIGASTRVASKYDRNLKLLINFVGSFGTCSLLEIACFAAIMGSGDLQGEIF
ncbi:retrovirus-related pol polyprotein from transposon TNT 1-94 [Tanacetum coccineum]